MQAFRLPKTLGSERLDTILNLLSSMRTEKEVTLDWSNVVEIEPAGLAIISIILDQAIEKECKIRNVNLSTAFKKLIPQSFLKIGKQKKLPVPSSHDTINETSFFLCCQGGLDLRYKNIIEQKFASLDSDLQFSIQLVFNELIQNTVDHSTSERYYIYFGLVKDEIHFGVLDMGVSLPAKMEQKYESEDDVSFLELSLKEGISTRRQRAGGLGLFHTFAMIKNLQGKFVFMSRAGQIRRYFAQRKVSKSNLKHKLSGTWVMFTFKNPGIEL